MSTILSIVIIVFIILTLICLIVPIRLRLTINDRRRSVFLSWLIVDLGSNLKEKTVELNIFSQTIIRKKSKKKTKDEVKRTKKRSWWAKDKIEKGEKKKSRFNLLDLWQKKDLVLRIIQIALRFLLDILKAIRWDRLSLEVDVATPDPALTGILYGELCAVKYSTDYFFPNAHVEVQPDFVNQLPRGRAETTFSIRPLSVVGPLSRMFFAMPKIQIVKTFILKKRR